MVGPKDYLVSTQLYLIVRLLWLRLGCHNINSFNPKTQFGHYLTLKMSSQSEQQNLAERRIFKNFDLRYETGSSLVIFAHNDLISIAYKR